jgi:mRNA interferase MazF
MDKEYEGWHIRKIWIARDRPLPYFSEREVWWCSVGINIGDEEDGKGPRYQRPVLIYRKFNARFFFGIPLTTSTKINKYAIPLGTVCSRKSQALVSQSRPFSAKRLITKMATIDRESVLSVRVALRNILAK